MGTPKVRRILHLFPPCGRGGTEAVIRFLARSLTSYGVESEAFFQRDIGGGCLFDGLCPVHYGDDHALTERLRIGGFDAIHAVSSGLTMGVNEAMRATGFTGPVIASCHGDYVVGWDRSNVSRIVALTEWWAAKIRPFTDAPVAVIGNPVDAERFSPPTERFQPRGRPVLGWIGHSADPRKNPDRLIEIMRALPADAYDWYIGDTDARPHSSEVFGDLSPRILKYGFLPHAEMPQVYRDIAASGGAVISTSDTEGFPLCILEAMASGCPVIVPDLWGADEIVDYGRAGLVFGTKDSPGNAVRCLQELRDPARWNELAQRGRAHVVQRYSPEVITRRYFDAFEECADIRRAGGAAYRLRRALPEAANYFRPMPTAVSLYRPRRAAEAMERAIRSNREGRPVRSALLEALRIFPWVYLKPWRAKFLLRTLISGRANG